VRTRGISLSTPMVPSGPQRSPAAPRLHLRPRVIPVMSEPQSLEVSQSIGRPEGGDWPIWASPTDRRHAANVPSISPNSPDLGEFRMFFYDDDRTYSDYIKLAIFGNLANFTGTFVNLSVAKISGSFRVIPPITSGLRITCASLMFGKFLRRCIRNICRPRRL
jgi:hypothetical protein